MVGDEEGDLTTTILRGRGEVCLSLVVEGAQGLVVFRGDGGVVGVPTRQEFGERIGLRIVARGRGRARRELSGECQEKEMRERSDLVWVRVVFGFEDLGGGPDEFLSIRDT
jgi:hypothetical protein